MLDFHALRHEERMTNQFNRMVAFRYRDFRYLWLGEMIFTIATQMQLFAINWHVFQLLRGQTFGISVLGNELILGSEAFGLGLLGLARVHTCVFSLLCLAVFWRMRRNGAW